MPKKIIHIKVNPKVRRSSCFFLFFILISTFEMDAQKFTGNVDFGLRAGLNMTTIGGSESSGLTVGLTVGAVGKYTLSMKSNLSAELLYTTGGMSSNRTIELTDVKVKIYDKTHLHYLAIPVLYQYYFTDVLGIEVGPRFGVCLGGKERTREGNERWESKKLSKSDYHVFDCGILAGIYTNDMAQESDFSVGFRIYFGLTNVMKDEGSNKNICIQLGIGYIIGE